MAFLGWGIGFNPLIRKCQQTYFFKVQMMVLFVNAQRNMITAAGPRAHYMAFLERKG
jgi:hypothetical protein